MAQVEPEARVAAANAVHAAQLALIARLTRLDASTAKLTAKWERLERLAAARKLVPVTAPNDASSPAELPLAIPDCFPARG